MRNRKSRRSGPIVHRPSRKFNVIGRSVEMAARKFYTAANFGCRGKLPGHNANGDWGSQG
jgi:hypothetical protein